MTYQTSNAMPSTAVAAVGLASLLVPGDVVAPKLIRQQRSVMAFSVSKPDDVNSVKYHEITGRELVAGQAEFFGHFKPTPLLQTFVKASLRVFFARFSVVMKKTEEMDDEDPQALANISLSDLFNPARHEHELSLWKGGKQKVKLEFFRDLLITTVQRTYEAIALEFVTRKTARGLVKGVSSSCVRKAARYEGQRLLVAKKVLFSSFKAQAMYWAAFVTVSSGFDAYYTYVINKKSTAQNSIVTREDKFSRRLFLNITRGFLCCVFAAVGASVGTTIKPGIGSFLGSFLLPAVVLEIIG